MERRDDTGMPVTTYFDVRGGDVVLRLLLEGLGIGHRERGAWSSRWVQSKATCDGLDRAHRLRSL